MNTYRPAPPSNYWLFALKILALVLGLYFSALILGKIFALVFTVTFYIFKFAVILGATFIVLHFFLKVLFKIDLVRLLFGSRFNR